MAVDEAVFRCTQQRGGCPTLRFYGWRRPTVSLGYFQNLAAEVDLDACEALAVDVVRRPTGGKAVYHDHELTYALVGSDRDGPFPADILGTYCSVSACLAEGLAALGFQAELADDGRGESWERLASSCFSAASRHELLLGGRKICGSAQVRSRGAFLQHGSLLLGFDAEKTYRLLLPHREPREAQIDLLRNSVTSLEEQNGGRGDVSEALQAAIARAVERRYDVMLRPGELTPEETALASHLLTNKYGRDRWTRQGKKKS